MFYLFVYQSPNYTKNTSGSKRGARSSGYDCVSDESVEAEEDELEDTEHLYNHASTSINLSKTTAGPTIPTTIDDEADTVQIEDEISDNFDVEIEANDFESQSPASTANHSPTQTGKRKRKILDEHGNWIDESDLHGRTIVHEPTRIIRRSSRKQGKILVDETSWDTNPFRLVVPKTYNPSEAPFKVITAPQVLLTLDFHAHLSLAEVIGLLGGKINGDTIHVLSIFPCQSIGSHRECEMDPVSEMEATAQFAEMGLIPVGWYHSHPTFEPNPSCRDIETQTMYQSLFRRTHDCKNGSDLCEPFLSFIVSPFLKASRKGAEAIVECIHLASKNAEDENFRSPYKLNYEIEETGEFFEYPDDLVNLFLRLFKSYMLTTNYAGLYEENYFLIKLGSRFAGSPYEQSARSVLQRFRERLKEYFAQRASA